MSAIAGILNVDGQPVDPRLLTQMTDVLGHRGPDGTGHWTNGSIGLGHRLLHTTPESLHETQPFVSDDGSLVIVCDARIDNRTELVATLSSSGILVRTDTDAELIVKAYERWGTSCPAHFLGDFAFVIWDRHRHRLFCARDPIGVKPFYYYWDGRRFLFASEIKALLAVPGVPKRINEGMIADYLLSDFRDPEATFFQGIRQLRPAHALSVEDGQRHQSRYWDLDPKAVMSYRRDEDYLEHFRELFREAVRCRLRSASPVGVMLSGGIDSTAVTAMAEALRRDDPRCPPLTAFTVLSEGFLQEEWEVIQRVVQRYGTEVRVVRLPTDQGRWALFEVYDTRSEVPSPVILTYPVVFEPIMATGRRVLLTGLGSDELIGMSDLGILKDCVRTCRLSTLIEEIRRMAWLGCITPRSIAFHLLREYIPRPIRWRIKALMGQQISPWISPRFAKRMRLAHRAPSWIPRRFPTMCQEESARAVTSAERALDLSQMDGVVSSFRIEWRHPFLDRRMIEFFLAVPSEVKRRAGQRKLFLQRAISDVVPGPLREQEGVEELVPLPNNPREWAAEARWIEQTLGRPDGPIFSYIDGNQLQQLLRGLVAGNLALRTPLWKLVHLDRWLRAFFGETTGTQILAGQASTTPVTVLEPLPS